MPEYHFVRNLSLTAAVDTLTNVSNDLSGASPGAIQVPAGVSRISEIHVWVANGANVTTAGGSTIGLRLTGNALVNGQQDLAVGGQSVIVDGTAATGSGLLASDTHRAVNLPVTPGNLLTIQAQQSGVDVGTPEISVEVVFS